MNKFKNEFLQNTEDEKIFDFLVEKLPILQKNLLKNYSNPIFKEKDRKNMLTSYNNLEKLGKSMYKYNMLKQNYMQEEAETEKTNFENILLKGGISYNRYIWRSENSGKTCKACKALDGKEFNFYDEIPERPHPNCKCTVEVIKERNPQNQEEYETLPTYPTTEQPKTPDPKPSEEPENQKWIMPCDGPITSKYGPRIPPVIGASDFHNGWDIAVPIGTPIKAIFDGKVITTGAARGYGNWVAIDHGKIKDKRVTSEYGHIKSWHVVSGQNVKKGQIIATSGNEGISSNPHLHITIREGETFQGEAVNPDKYINFGF